MYIQYTTDIQHNKFYILIDTKGKSSRPNPSTVANGDKTAKPLTMANKSLTLLWGATGEQEWTPALTTGLL